MNNGDRSDSNVFLLVDQTHLRMDHLVYDSAIFINPLALANYGDEDWIGKCKKLAQICNPVNLGFQTLQRIAAYQCCRWLRVLSED